MTCGVDPLAEITNEGAFKDEYAALEVYHASHTLYPEELSFGEQILKAADSLKRIISTDSNRLSKFVHKEVLILTLTQNYVSFCMSGVIYISERLI